MKKKINYFFYISIIIGIIFLIFIVKNLNSYKENFSSNIKFMDKNEVKDFILKDEDKYINNLSIYDLRARKSKTCIEYLFKAGNSTLDFTQEQKEKLIMCANQAKLYFNNNMDWVFALITNNYEEGFPHTRANIIFLSETIINYSNIELIKTLIHESVHIYQRYNKEEIKKYLEKNNFTISRTRNNTSLMRANPDLDEYIYKDKNGIEMIANYNTEFPSGITDIKLPSLSNEHPFEYMAYEIAEEYSRKILNKYNNVK
jgi:hypothetical protein